MQPKNKKDSAQLHKNASILVIEDKADQWQLTKQAIERTFKDIKPVWAPNPQQAMTYLEDCLMIGLRAPLLILLDLYLPERETGWQLLEQIRNLSAPLGQLPIILLSSSCQQEDITQSYQRGITTYVIKPTSVSEWTGVFMTLKEYWIDTVSLPQNGHSH